jgi:uncharacterized protein YcbX
VAELLIYPVKSLGGDAHGAAQVEPTGLAGDRRWMVVDAAGRFMTQREHPGMALVQARLAGEALVLLAPGMAELVVPIAPDGAARAVTVWRDTVPARDAGDTAAAWLTAAIGRRCRLVHLADPAARKLRADFARDAREVVSFADGFPVLLASLASLADLNNRMARPVPMSRFRPNLVVADAPAWAEDSWRLVRIGTAVFRVAKPCDRCVMTTIDQRTGLQPDGLEPLRSLATFRRDQQGRIMFGQNLVPEQCGVITAGDAVEVIEAGPPNVALLTSGVASEAVLSR